MKTEAVVLTPETLQQAYKQQDIETSIAQLKEKYMQVEIAGIDDKAGYGLVYEGYQISKNLCVQIEKRRKELKADSLEYGRNVDKVAAELTALCEPMRDLLGAKRKAIDDEKERIKNEVIEAERKRIAAIEAERLRIENEKAEAERQAERERLDKVRIEQEAEANRLDAIRKEQEAEALKIRQEQGKIETEKRKIEQEKQAAIDKENKRIADEKAATEQKIRDEQLKKEAAEKAIRDKEAADILAKEQEAEMAAQAPDKDKLKAVIVSLESMNLPIMKSAKYKKIEAHYRAVMSQLINDLKNK